MEALKHLLMGGMALLILNTPQIPITEKWAIAALVLITFIVSIVKNIKPTIANNN